MARSLCFRLPLLRNLAKPRLFGGANDPLSSSSVVRRYARKTWGRTPVKVIIPGEEEKPSWGSELRPGQHGQHGHQEPDSAVPHYVKLRDDSKIFTTLVTKAKTRNQREKTGKIMLEGKRLIRDAMQAGARADAIFFTQEEHLEGLDVAKLPSLKLYKITYQQLSLWSDLVTSPGIIGIFEIFDYEDLKAAGRASMPLTVVCDNVREPGNMGAIVRCGAAVGCKQILLTKGCVDPWDPKVLRAACGAHFRTIVENNVGWESICNYVAKDATVYLASSDCVDNGGEQENEDEPPDFDQHRFKAPRHYEVAEDGRMVQPVYDFRDEEPPKSLRFPIESTSYRDVAFGLDKDIVVIVGGETRGLSGAARRFAYDRFGRSIFIPLENDVESLNSGVALGIILFEIQRQLLTAQPRQA